MNLRRSFRLRLALWAGGLFAAALGLLGWGVVELLTHQQLRELDDRLRLTSYEIGGPLPGGPRPLPERTGLMMLVVGPRGETLRATPDFPAALETALATLAISPDAEVPREVRASRDATSNAAAAPVAGGPLLARPRPPPGTARGPPAPEIKLINLGGPEGEHWRVAWHSAAGRRLFVAADTRRALAGVGEVLTAALWLSPAAVLLVGAGGWVLADRAIRPTRKLTAAARGVSANRLGQRIASEDEDAEFAELIGVFNAMLERLERSFTQAVRFGDNAAHELKTPLTILQGQLEVALRDSGGAQPDTLLSMMEEVQRLKMITERLLLLAKSDGGNLVLERSRIDFGSFVEDLAEDIEILGPGLTCERQCATGVWVDADPILLSHAVSNLLNNAIKYNRPGGRVRIEVEAVNGQARLAMENTGPGIPPEAVSQLFERFFRADPARNRGIDGVGLGLNLAREIARAHQGDVVLAATAPDQVRFHLLLPLARPASGE